ncbi:MAG: efflux RND transporter periplasmic adaptor subunit [Thermoanaerobaculia bacterium]
MNWRFIIAATTVALLVSGCTKSEEAHPEKSAGVHTEDAHEGPENILDLEESLIRDLRLTTAEVAQRPGGEGVNVVGDVQPDQARYAEVGSAVTARVVRLLVAPGQAVRAGQLLAEAQSTELGRIRADHESAATRVTLAQAALDRKRALADRIVPRREVEDAEAALAAARAELRAAQASLQALGAGAGGGKDPSRLPLVAPIAGTVLTRNVSIGQLIDPGHVAFRIGDLRTVWLMAHAFERDAVRVQPGTPARVTLAAYPGQVFEGRVTWIGDEVEHASRTIPVRVELANRAGMLRPGMSANAWLQISTAGANVIAVPAAALQRLRDQWVVFIPKSDSVFEIRPVGRGRDLQGEVEILRGLTPGETIVVDGSFLLKAEAEKSEGGGDEHGH